jgi:hypothetical protein
MSERESVYVGYLKLRSGKQEEVRLRLGVHHWIDADGRRWSNINGKRSTRRASQEVYPYLILASIVEVQNAGRSFTRKMTHEGHIRSFGLKKTAKGRLHQLRETKMYWIDSFGRKFHKKDGWEVAPEPNLRVLLNTVKPIVRDYSKYF